MKSTILPLVLLLLLALIRPDFAALEPETKPDTAPESTRESKSGSITFAAMGDMPYKPQEYDQMRRQIAGVDDRCAFLVHLGDIKKGKDPCDEVIYQRVAALLRASKRPVFIVPGDNEYNDCTNPAQAWQFWVKHFMRFDEHWKNSAADLPAVPKIKAIRQEKRQEHFAFVRQGVLFVGVHVVGGRVHDEAEWAKRMKDAVDWLAKQIATHGKSVRATAVLGHATPTKNQALFFSGFEKIAKDWSKPMLYIHGDGHTWKKDRPFKAENILRVQVDAGGKAPPVRVTITEDMKEPFVFNRGAMKLK